LNPEFEDLWFKYLPAEIDSFDAIYSLFQELWDCNQKVNLFSRKLDERTVFIDHIIDCALALPYFDESQVILDFGCGGGLPGAVLATCRPLKHFYLLDKSQKKIHYLQKICQNLELVNCECMTEPDQKSFEQVDTLTSRAVASTTKIQHWMQQNKLDCKVLLYKARRETIDAELKEIENSACSIRVHPLNYPENLKERHLLEIS
jgi:16S rRNA (guanine527-N7)-methyltransferase